MASTPDPPAAPGPLLASDAELRDYFATRAPAPPSRFYDTEDMPSEPELPDRVTPKARLDHARAVAEVRASHVAKMQSKWAYLYADAMMEARKNGRG
jgi:hypothetical protein